MMLHHALVTGASSGIGMALAQQISKYQPVILHGRDSSRLRIALDGCSPGPHVIWQHDLVLLHETRDSLALLLSEQRLSVNQFVHCAAQTTVSATRLIQSNSMVETMSVNFFSALEITACLLGQRINQNSLSNVLFLSSIWGQFGARGHAMYCASKGALESAMRSLATELAPKVRVNCVALGAVDTPMASRALSDPEIKNKIAIDYPLGIGSIEQAVEVCMFLMSQSSSWITGQVITADGGRTAHMSNK